MRFRFCHAAFTILLSAAVAPAALAQTRPLGGNIGPPAAAAPPKLPPPPALPGATSNNGGAPAMRSPVDMEPNDALFDAINRGDIGSARDAISRGADLASRNVLGMTPLELSIDLGRNDISFLLLSMRAADDSRRPPPPVTTAKGPAGKQVARQATPRAAAPVRAQTASPPPRAQTARLYSNDGGAPIPDAGFLGFDSGRR